VRPGLRLAAGLALAVLASVSPAGLGGRPVPAWSWAVWAAAFAAGAHGFASAGSTSAQLARRLGWLLPVVLALALPAAVAAAAGARVETALALVARSLAATTAAAGTVFRLGPLGLLRGARALGLPERLAQVMEARAMLRARAARRPGGGAWERLLRAPAGTLRGFGRFGAALLLRTLERAEAQERARRARGADLA
jgi:hypothetical protein